MESNYIVCCSGSPVIYFPACIYSGMRPSFQIKKKVIRWPSNGSGLSKGSPIRLNVHITLAMILHEKALSYGQDTTLQLYFIANGQWHQIHVVNHVTEATNIAFACIRYDLVTKEPSFQDDSGLHGNVNHVPVFAGMAITWLPLNHTTISLTRGWP